MYEFLEGQVAGAGPARLVLDVGGVGYDLSVPLGARLPREGRVRIWTHLAVREDAHTLYGFASRADREVFRLLLKVRGVGPTMALGILSGLDRASLLAAIVAEDAKALTRVKGVGKKTAEQILLDLRDKAGLLAEGLEDHVLPSKMPAKATATADDTCIEDAAQALISIGYGEKDARRAVAKAAESVGLTDVEELVRTAVQG